MQELAVATEDQKNLVTMTDATDLTMRLSMSSSKPLEIGNQLVLVGGVTRK